MKNITLKQLRYFEILANYCHFGRAADVAAISQPALSMQIKELEQNFNLRLLDRRGRKVSLTPFGEDIVARTRDILRLVDEFDEINSLTKDGFWGKLRLGVIPTIAPYLLPQLISKITQQRPSIDLHIRETLTEHLLFGLKARKIDAAIVALPVSGSDFEELPIFSEEFVLLRSKTEDNTQPPNRSDLSKMRLLLLEDGHCFRDQALSFWMPKVTHTHELIDGSSLLTLVQMVGAGLGVTLIPEIAIKIETRSTSVAINRFDAPSPGRTIGMIWRKSSPLTKELTFIAKLVGTVVDELELRSIKVFTKL